MHSSLKIVDEFLQVRMNSEAHYLRTLTQKKMGTLLTLTRHPEGFYTPFFTPPETQFTADASVTALRTLQTHIL
jgi:hypothetical protein